MATKIPPRKYKVLSLGNRLPKDTPTLHLYLQHPHGSLEKILLQETTREKNIGVFVNNKLSFRDQINTKTTEANTIMGIIIRNFNYINSFHASL